MDLTLVVCIWTDQNRRGRPKHISASPFWRNDYLLKSYFSFSPVKSSSFLFNLKPYRRLTNPLLSPLQSTYTLTRSTIFRTDHNKISCHPSSPPNTLIITPATYPPTYYCHIVTMSEIFPIYRPQQIIMLINSLICVSVLQWVNNENIVFPKYIQYERIIIICSSRRSRCTIVLTQ